MAPPLLQITYLEAAILGTVLGAVSPAIAVPKMLHLMESGYGKGHAIPQMIMAGASVDNIFNIALFTALMGIYSSHEFSAMSVYKLPVSLAAGLIAGVLLGYALAWTFKRIHMRDTVKVMLVLGIAFAMVGLEEPISKFVPFSGLFAVMALGGALLKAYEVVAKRLAGKFSKIWVAAELILFVLLGSIVDIQSAAGAGFPVIGLIFAALICRSIGALPLAAGMPAGNIIFTTAVLAVLITSPLGAIGIEQTYRQLLEKKADLMS